MLAVDDSAVDSVDRDENGELVTNKGQLWRRWGSESQNKTIKIITQNDFGGTARVEHNNPRQNGKPGKLTIDNTSTTITNTDYNIVIVIVMLYPLWHETTTADDYNGLFKLRSQLANSESDKW